jgi:hypothetical protein
VEAEYVHEDGCETLIVGTGQSGDHAGCGKPGFFD